MLVRLVRFIALFAVSLALSLTFTYLVGIRPLWKRWGIDPAEATRPLPGDDLVPVPSAIETRGITIAAPPSAVWPWLVQMGYGRAGWYSYDAIDMVGKSVNEIHPEWQTLGVGDLLPTHPAGGFEIKAIEPERSLVLYLDTAMATAQAARAATEETESTAPNVEATGRALGAMTPPQFAASWTFVLEPAPEGTRLIERFRFQGEMTGAFAPLAGGLLGHGVFFMARKQMLGIQARAERVARESSVLTSFATTLGQKPETAMGEEPGIRVKVRTPETEPMPEGMPA